MPGTLMAEGCLQALAFYIAALGMTRERDGWRFEPVPETQYKFVCRGQATPRSRELVYELFIDEAAFSGDEPTVFAHVLCTVDGLKSFHCERLGLRLVKDYPMTSQRSVEWQRPTRLPTAMLDGHRFDHRSIVACALGDPIAAFGERFRPFAKNLRCSRLPNPPYLFCTHVAHADRTLEHPQVKASVDMVYDLDAAAWYFTEHSHPVMALCALLEMALQPCGWLSSLMLEPEFAAWQPLFRNLDGIGTLHREIQPDDGSVITRVQMRSRVVLGEQVIWRFKLVCMIGTECVFECATSFGSFSPRALAETKGMIPSASESVAAMAS